MSLKRLFQVCAVEELQAGDGISGTGLYAAANANYLVIDPMIEFNPEQFDRANINRASLSPFSPLAGVVTGAMTFQLELSGTGAATSPPFGLLLEACGMKESDTYQIPGALGANEIMYNGETVLQAVSGDTGVVVHDTYVGEVTLLIRTASGALADAGNAWVGATSGSTWTPTAVPTAFGISWTPDSVELVDLDFTTDTGVNVIGDVVIGNVSGAIAILQETPAAPTPLTVSVRVLDGVFVNGEDAENQTTPGAELAVIKAATTVQTNVPALSMAVIEDGPSKALLGCRGNFSLSGNIGEAMLFSFEFTGLKNAITDEGTVTGITYTTQVPPVMLGVTFDIWDDDRVDAGTPTGTYSPRFSSMSLDYANAVGIGRDAGEATGVYGSAHITSRNTSGSMTIDVAPEGAFAFIEAVSAGTPTHMKLQIGSAIGNEFIISCPSAVFTGESGGETEGIATRDLPFRVGSRHPDGTDADDCELIITYQHTATA